MKNFLVTQDCPIILDPVLAFKEGQTKANQEYQHALQSLFSLATIVTPNLVEAEYFANQAITTREEMKIAAKNQSTWACFCVDQRWRSSERAASLRPAL